MISRKIFVGYYLGEPLYMGIRRKLGSSAIFRVAPSRGSDTRVSPFKGSLGDSLNEQTDIFFGQTSQTGSMVGVNTEFIPQL